MRGRDGLPGWATPPTYETDGPRTEQGFTCGTRWSPRRCHTWMSNKNRENTECSRDFSVGLAGFEPTTP